MHSELCGLVRNMSCGRSVFQTLCLC